MNICKYLLLALRCCATLTAAAIPMTLLPSVPAAAAVGLATKTSTMTLIINIETDGTTTQEAVIGTPTVVDQHMQLGWASTKLTSASLAQLPAFGVAAINSNSDLATIEDAAFVARRTAFSTAYMRPMATWLRTNNIDTAWIDVRQKIIHKGATKMARNVAFVWPSGYWHMNKVRVRALDGSLKVLYAEYRPVRDLTSQAEDNEIPLSQDANIESGRVGLYLTVKDLGTWSDLTTPAKFNLLTSTGFALDTLANTNFPNWSSTDPNTLVVDPNWPGQCLIDRTYVDKSGGARACPNGTDLKAISASYDVDFVVLDMYSPPDWRMVPTSTPGIFAKDYRITVTSRKYDCDPFVASQFNFSQTAVLTGTAKLHVDRYFAYPDGTVNRVQQFDQPYQINYPYSAGFDTLRSNTGRWMAFNSCGQPYMGVDNGAVTWNESTCSGDPVSLTIPRIWEVAAIKPSYRWMVGGDRGRFTGIVPSVLPSSQVLLQGTAETPSSHWTFASTGQFVGTNCFTPQPTSCPPNTSLVAGVCQPNACPDGQARNAAGVCDTCPARGMIRDGSGNCMCPVCQMVGSDASGAVCVADPNQNTGVCSGIKTCQQELQNNSVCDSWRIFPGSSPAAVCNSTTLAGGFMPDASPTLGNCACPDGHVWQWSNASAVGRCFRLERDVCSNLPGVQERAPAGYYQWTTPSGDERCDPYANLGNACSCEGFASYVDSGSRRTITATCADPGVGRIRQVVVFDLSTRRFISSTATQLSGDRIAECAAAAPVPWADFLP